MPVSLIGNFSQKETEAHRKGMLEAIIFSKVVPICFGLYSIMSAMRQNRKTSKALHFPFSLCALRKYDVVVE